jgi:hypothetical protein
MKTIEGQLKDKIEELESKLEMVIAIDTNRAKEGKEIIAELKAENEKLRGNTDRVGIFKSLNY